MTTPRLDQQSRFTHHATPAAAPPVLVELLEETGIQFNGEQPWDIRVFDDALYRRVLAKGSLGEETGLRRRRTCQGLA